MANEENRLYEITTPWGRKEYARGRTREEALENSFNGSEYKKEWYLRHCRIRRVYEYKLKSGKITIK